MLPLLTRHPVDWESFFSILLDKQSIRYKAKNGVLTLKGSVKNPTQRQEAQELAKNTPNVQQVVNEIQVQR